jgi:cytochrome c oxidase cbb3-type subunit 3
MASVLLTLALAGPPVLDIAEAQPLPVGSGTHTQLPASGTEQPGPITAERLLQVPVVTLHPGDVPVSPGITSPVAGDPEAPLRGMEYFVQMNCVGCHAANGAGGMGPALSNSRFIYGNEPANIYLSILQGRPHGMPAWGELLPDQVIWDLVAYIQNISADPSRGWGRTTSVKGFTIEQVPAEFQKTAEPWQHTQPFSYGQRPDKKPPPSVKGAQ